MTIQHFSHVMFLVQEVNCQLQLDEAGFGILRPTRELVPGPSVGSVGSSVRTLAQQDCIQKRNVCRHLNRYTDPLFAGEELFISYGASEWFTDRGLISEVAKAAESTAEFGGLEEKILNPRLKWRHTSICKCLVPCLHLSPVISSHLFLSISWS